jgi:hypothetical protein
MMEPKPRCLGSIFVSIYRVTKGRDGNRSTQVFGKLATLSLQIALPQSRHNLSSYPQIKKRVQFPAAFAEGSVVRPRIENSCGPKPWGRS